MATRAAAAAALALLGWRLVRGGWRWGWSRLAGVEAQSESDEQQLRQQWEQVHDRIEIMAALTATAALPAAATTAASGAVGHLATPSGASVGEAP